jgi:hypothetical protein
VEHPFPGIELEGEFDAAVVEIDEAAVVAQPMSSMSISVVASRPGARCPRDRPACRHPRHFSHAGEMQMACRRASSRLDQRSWIELNWSARFGMMLRSIACSSQVHWKHRRLEDRGRRIRVVFQQFRRLAPSKLRSSRP